MIWMLLLTTYSNHGVSTISVPYTSEQACVYAGQTHKKNFPNSIIFTCSNGGAK